MLILWAAKFCQLGWSKQTLKWPLNIPHFLVFTALYNLIFLNRILVKIPFYNLILTNRIYNIEGCQFYDCITKDCDFCLASRFSVLSSQREQFDEEGCAMWKRPRGDGLQPTASRLLLPPFLQESLYKNWMLPITRWTQKQILLQVNLQIRTQLLPTTWLQPFERFLRRRLMPCLNSYSWKLWDSKCVLF